MSEHDLAWTNALELALRITEAERRCDDELGIEPGSTKVAAESYQRMTFDKVIPWQIYGLLVKAMGWTAATRSSDIHAILVRTGWPTVLVVCLGRGYVAGYVSDAPSHDKATKENAIHWKCEFAAALRVCLDVLNGKLSDRNDVVRALQRMDPSAGSGA